MIPLVVGQNSSSRCSQAAALAVKIVLTMLRFGNAEVRSIRDSFNKRWVEVAAWAGKRKPPIPSQGERQRLFRGDRAINGNPVKAQGPKAKKRTENLAGQTQRRKRRATPKQLGEMLKAAMDVGCTPRGAFLGADGSIELNFGIDDAERRSDDWDKLIDATH